MRAEPARTRHILATRTGYVCRNSRSSGRVDETKDDWLQYVERLEHFLAANGIDDANKKRAVLLTVVGAATLQDSSQHCFSEEAGREDVRGARGGLVEALQAYSLGNCRTVQVSLSCAEGGRIDRYLRRRTSYAVGILQLLCDIERHAIRSLGLRCERPSHSEATPRSVRPDVSEGRGLALSAETAAQSMRELGVSQRAVPLHVSAGGA